MNQRNISHYVASSAREERAMQRTQKKQQGQKRHPSPHRTVAKKQRFVNTVPATNVAAHQDQAVNHPIRSTLGIEEAETSSAADRQDTLAASTRKHYQRYQAHWTNWCQRKKYPDDDEVTHPKLLAYIQELVADEAVLANDDADSIRPIRVHVTNGYEGDLPSPETIDAYIKSVIDLYSRQRDIAGQSTSDETTFSRTKEVAEIIKKYKRRYREWKRNQDALRPIIASDHGPGDLKQALRTNWTRNYKHQNGGTKTNKIIGARNRVSLSWGQFMTASGAGVRTALLSDLYPHQFAVRENGKQFAFCVALMMAQGKTNQDHELFSCFVRNKDVEICPVSCLAFYLLELWMQPQSVPDFKQNEWKLEHLIHGSSKTEAMASTTLYRSQKGVVSCKTTHGGRRAGAQHAHASRICTEDATHNGHWNHRRLVTHSLTQVSREEPYMMAGFTLPKEEFWLERNTTLPPKELQKMVFPFIEDLFPGNQDWAKWIENIMEDNPENLNRPQSSRVDYPIESIPAMRLMLVLAHLRKVVLQDAVVLLRITDDPLCLYSQHDVFTTLPVFSSTMFKEYSLLLQESIQDAARSPLVNELRSLKTALWTLEAFIRQNFDKVERHFEGISRQLAPISQAIDRWHGGMMNQSIEYQQQESQPMSDDDMDGEEQDSADEPEYGQEQVQPLSVEPSEDD